jgi:hypothetical protein
MFFRNINGLVISECLSRRAPGIKSFLTRVLHYKKNRVIGSGGAPSSVFCFDPADEEDWLNPREETDMTNALPPLHNGHAPITLQELFREALYAFEEWDTELTEPIVTFEGRVVPISLVFEAMRECDDIVPNNIVGAVTERLTKPWEGEGPLDQMTFSTAGRVMRVLVRKRLLANGTADVVALPTHAAERTPSE